MFSVRLDKRLPVEAELFPRISAVRQRTFAPLTKTKKRHRTFESRCQLDRFIAFYSQKEKKISKRISLKGKNSQLMHKQGTKNEIFFTSIV
jgi:hypothetical protein